MLIDFWDTRCGPCQKVIPKLNTLKDKIVVIGNSDEPKGTVKQMKHLKLQYYLAIDT